MRGKTKNLSEWALKSLSEPGTLNQGVVGSNPTAPTNNFNYLATWRRTKKQRVRTVSAITIESDAINSGVGSISQFSTSRRVRGLGDAKAFKVQRNSGLRRHD